MIIVLHFVIVAATIILSRTAYNLWITDCGNTDLVNSQADNWHNCSAESLQK